MADEERRKRVALSTPDKQAAFVAAVMAALFLAAWTVVALITGEWQWVAAGALSLLLTVVLIAVIGGLFKLSERLFPGWPMSDEERTGSCAFVWEDGNGLHDCRKDGAHEVHKCTCGSWWPIGAEPFFSGKYERPRR